MYDDLMMKRIDSKDALGWRSSVSRSVADQVRVTVIDTTVSGPMSYLMDEMRLTRLLHEFPHILP